MLDVKVRFDEKDATVRYLPGKVTLDQIIQRYQDTPFGVVSSGPVVTTLRMPQATIRGWAERTKPDTTAPKSASDSQAPQPIELVLTVSTAAGTQAVAAPALKFADPPASGLAALEGFQRAKTSDGAASRDRASSVRFMAKLYETVALAPGETTVPVNLEFKGTETGDSDARSSTRLEIVLRTTRKSTVVADPSVTGVALIGGTLELRLGHLCEQRGCVHHFHQSLSEMSGLGAVDPHPSLENPRATLYLRAGRAVDVWGLREGLRRQSIEVAGIVPGLDDVRLRIELPRWRHRSEQPSTGDAALKSPQPSQQSIEQCVACRERVAGLLATLDWAEDVVVAGGGINVRPNRSGLDLVELLDAITESGAAASAVWLVPAGVPMPKPGPALEVKNHASRQNLGSQAHPVVEIDLVHTCPVGTRVASLLNQQKWISQAQVGPGDITRAWASIGDRKFANLTPLLTGLQSAGQTPHEIRLRDFGDIRVQLEFAHICGDVVYSKPPKPKKKKKKDESAKQDEKPKKPFVPQPKAMATTSNGHQAIKRAIESVGWVKDGLFYDFHTRFDYRGGPRKITFALQANGDDVVRLDGLVSALRDAGFPPKSLVVSRRFPGIPFGKPLPGDLKLADREGQTQPLAFFKKPGRPLAVAFVFLKTKSRSYGKYKADPQLYGRFGTTIETYKDRVDIVAISANEHDEFADVASFWDQTGLDVPLLHDADGLARAVFNVQITPPPHLFVFDADGQLRYAGDAHSHWEKPDEKHEDYLSQALDLVFAGKYLDNGAVFYNKSLCNCSHPKCKCPKCGCGSSCRCGIKHCSVGF